MLNYLNIIVLQLEHLDSLGERHANRLMSWGRLQHKSAALFTRFPPDRFRSNFASLDREMRKKIFRDAKEILDFLLSIKGIC